MSAQLGVVAAGGGVCVVVVAVAAETRRPADIAAGDITESLKSFCCRRKVLLISSGMGEVGTVKWDLALCLLLAWIVVYFCIWKGVKSSGKVTSFATGNAPHPPTQPPAPSHSDQKVARSFDRSIPPPVRFTSVLVPVPVPVFPAIRNTQNAGERIIAVAASHTHMRGSATDARVAYGRAVVRVGPPVRGAGPRDNRSVPRLSHYAMFFILKVSPSAVAGPRAVIVRPPTLKHNPTLPFYNRASH